MVQKQVMLVRVSAQANNNKFYEVILHDDDTVTTRYGRVGSEGNAGVSGRGEAFYNRTVRAKNRKGYKETETVTNQTTVNAVAKERMNAAVHKGLSQSDEENPVLTRLFDTLVEQNRHQIVSASGGQIEVADDGAMRTALGIITDTSITEAREVLKKIAKAKTPDSAESLRLLDQYLTLVPQNVGRTAGWHERYFRSETISQQNDFLDQLAGSYAIWEQAKNAQSTEGQEEDYSDLFRYRMSVVEDKDAFERINKFFRSSVNQNHSSRRLSLKKVYAVHDTHGTETYETALTEKGNEMELWHGTNAGNVLSILSKGLFVPDRSQRNIHITGRMFGDGVYFSNQSTKSLNYSYGYWSGRRNSHCFMFLADVVLGNSYLPTQGHSAARRDAHKKHDSIFADPSNTRDVRNNEVIVWNTDQIALRYLCEFDS